eukprot:snap_masked-scaffold_15-processed-gene-5.10-mRNA-1 protein AED:1.00 eAED:1.00 QI:0/0/0/0/1/1/2/0/70
MKTSPCHSNLRPFEFYLYGGYMFKNLLRDQQKKNGCDDIIRSGIIMFQVSLFLFDRIEVGVNIGVGYGTV